MAALCEHANEPLDSIIVGEFLDELSDHEILKKHSAAWFEIGYVKQGESLERLADVITRLARYKFLAENKSTNYVCTLRRL